MNRPGLVEGLKSREDEAYASVEDVSAGVGERAMKLVQEAHGCREGTRAAAAQEADAHPGAGRGACEAAPRRRALRRELADMFGVARSTVYRAIERAATQAEVSS
ncbi:hypothetical protein GCM10017596_21150 [Microbacterium keratanolyticum]|uniref:Uncharacterized protein n=1 Tax=Microbacterium keratanolyticum TaxID=67574 RepID=A0A9W6HUX2_9MICO|nr:hypothetical protein GCM10017596_21150 [Microbacterium keratanolyticum]